MRKRMMRMPSRGARNTVAEKMLFIFQSFITYFLKIKSKLFSQQFTQKNKMCFFNRMFYIFFSFPPASCAGTGDSMWPPFLYWLSYYSLCCTSVYDGYGYYTTAARGRTTSQLGLRNYTTISQGIVKGVSLKTKTVIFAILCMFKQCIIEEKIGISIMIRLNWGNNKNILNTENFLIDSTEMLDLNSYQT